MQIRRGVQLCAIGVAFGGFGWRARESDDLPRHVGCVGLAIRKLGTHPPSSRLALLAYTGSHPG
ncbi:MAG TPA: hypothetical protein VMR33_16115 [Candidatus Baltobacteraceae bacterium]|nr:hypothetical protein [Candidatus Baltobacteraceae bacterium]